MGCCTCCHHSHRQAHTPAYKRWGALDRSQDHSHCTHHHRYRCKIEHRHRVDYRADHTVHRCLQHPDSHLHHQFATHMHPARFERTLYAVVADLHTYSVVVRDHTHLACTQPDRYLDNQPHHSRGHTHHSGRLNTLDPVDRANLRIPRRHCPSGCNDHNKHQDRDRYHRSWTSMVHSDCYRIRCCRPYPCRNHHPAYIMVGKCRAGQECLDSRGNNGGLAHNEF